MDTGHHIPLWQRPFGISPWDCLVVVTVSDSYAYHTESTHVSGREKRDPNQLHLSRQHLDSEVADETPMTGWVQHGS